MRPLPLRLLPQGKLLLLRSFVAPYSRRFDFVIVLLLCLPCACLPPAIFSHSAFIVARIFVVIAAGTLCGNFGRSCTRVRCSLMLALTDLSGSMSGRWFPIHSSVGKHQFFWCCNTGRCNSSACNLRPKNHIWKTSSSKSYPWFYLMETVYAHPEHWVIHHVRRNMNCWMQGQPLIREGFLMTLYFFDFGKEYAKIDVRAGRVKDFNWVPPGNASAIMPPLFMSACWIVKRILWRRGRLMLFRVLNLPAQRRALSWNWWSCRFHSFGCFYPYGKKRVYNCWLVFRGLRTVRVLLASL